MSKSIVIAGTHSGCGKTIVTLGILATLKKKGFKVQAFKVGPDFIDTGLHGLIAERPSRNLDIWMCGREYVIECFYKNSEGADIAIVEGVMGLFDGGDASTAEVARTLGLPVVLIVDAHSMAESAAALVKGFETFDKKVNIAGVILNKVAGERHLGMLSDAVKKYTSVRVLGYLPKKIEFSIPERHLGLLVAEESPIPQENLDHLAEAALRCINMDMIVELTNKTTVRSFQLVGNLSYADKEGLRTSRNDNKTKVAVAYDKAFCFYYEDNLDLLREAGTEIVLFSPLTDSEIPANVDAIYIGGGYPEIYAHLLSKNESMLNAICKWALSGRPIYAECGGLMYLSKGIYDFDGNFYRMAQVFPFETVMKKRRVNLGYREVRLLRDSILGRRGDVLRGHEFHYSEIIKTNDPMPETIYQVTKSSGEEFLEGYFVKNTLASYVHIHFGSNPDIANNLIKFSMEA